MFIFWSKNILKFHDVYKIVDESGHNDLDMELEAQSFRVRVLRELADAEKHGVDPVKIMNARKLLDV